jgi:hypothetical protein
MIIVTTPSVAFDLGQLAYILADGIYLKTPSGPAKIPGVPDAEVAAVKAQLDTLLAYGHPGSPDSIKVIKVPVPADPGGGGS